MTTRYPWLIAVLIIFAFGHVRADTPTSPAVMKYADGRIEGEGAALLRAELPGAQFILIGEEHGFADSPEIALAIAREAHAFGVVHHAMEVGPRTGALLNDILREGDEIDLAAFLAGRPLAMPFANMAEDARLADFYVDAAPESTTPLWGVDQEFVGATLIYLDSLVRMAGTPEVAAMVQTRLDAERKAFASGNMGALILLSSTPEDFQILSEAFVGHPEALSLIKALAESAEIYGLYSSGANYASNATRVAMIRRQFLAAYSTARQTVPRALFKFGASHLGRGTGPLNTFDLGSLTEGIAAANGLGVLRIAILPLQGQQTVMDPAAELVFQTVDYRADALAALLESAGIDEELIPMDGYAVIPLADLRTRLEQKGLGALSAENRFLVLGYDYLVTTRGSRPATPLAR